MPRLPLMRATPWGRIIWMVQIVMAGIQELDVHERRQAREIAQRVYRDRRLSPHDRQKLSQLAKKAGKGAARGVRGGGLSGFRRGRR